MITLRAVLALQDMIRKEHPTEAEWTSMRRIVGEFEDQLQKQERLKQRAEEYDGLLEYVNSLLDSDEYVWLEEGREDEFWDRLERTLDDLDRGMSETMEAYAEWRGKEERRVSDLQVLFIAAHQWKSKVSGELAKPLPSLSNYDRLRMRREVTELSNALAGIYPEVQDR